MKLTDKEKLKIFDELHCLPKHIRRAKGLYSVHDLAKELKIYDTGIQYHIDRGHLPERSVTIGKRMFWTKQEYDTAKDYCSVRHYTVTPRKKLLSPEQEGEMKRLYATGKHTQKELGKRFGVSQPYVSRVVRVIGLQEQR